MSQELQLRLSPMSRNEEDREKKYYRKNLTGNFAREYRIFTQFYMCIVMKIIDLRMVRGLQSSEDVGEASRGSL
jgi:hypothetical protein